MNNYKSSYYIRNRERILEYQRQRLLSYKTRIKTKLYQQEYYRKNKNRLESIRKIYRENRKMNKTIQPTKDMNALKKQKQREASARMYYRNRDAILARKREANKIRRPIIEHNKPLQVVSISRVGPILRLEFD